MMIKSRIVIDKLKLILFFLLVSQIPSIAQNMADDFGMVYKYYNELAFYKMDIKVLNYQKEDAEPVLAGNGQMIKYKDKFYSHFDGIKTIYNGKEFLLLNKREKWLSYQVNESNTASLAAMNANQYKKMLEDWVQHKSKYLGQKDGIKRYRITIENEVMKYLEIAIDIQKKILTQVVYVYHQKDGEKVYADNPYKVVINYQVDLSSKPADKWFETTEYLSMKEGKVQLNPKYKHYELIQEEN